MFGIKTKNYHNVQIIPNLILGEEVQFTSGDILDANYIISLIDEKIKNAFGSTITVWTGSSSTGHIFFEKNSENYNIIFGKIIGLANFQPGDIIRFHYENAEVGNQIWVQANFDNPDTSMTDATYAFDKTSGYHDVVVTNVGFNNFKEKGIRFRRPTDSIYTITKIEIVKK